MVVPSLTGWGWEQRQTFLPFPAALGSLKQHCSHRGTFSQPLPHPLCCLWSEAAGSGMRLKLCILEGFRKVWGAMPGTGCGYGGGPD